MPKMTSMRQLKSDFIIDKANSQRNQRRPVIQALPRKRSADFLAFSITAGSAVSAAAVDIHFFPKSVCAASSMIPAALKSPSFCIASAKAVFVFSRKNAASTAWKESCMSAAAAQARQSASSRLKHRPPLRNRSNRVQLFAFFEARYPKFPILRSEVLPALWRARHKSPCVLTAREFWRQGKRYRYKDVQRFHCPSRRPPLRTG